MVLRQRDIGARILADAASQVSDDHMQQTRALVPETAPGAGLERVRAVDVHVQPPGAMEPATAPAPGLERARA